MMDEWMEEWMMDEWMMDEWMMDDEPWKECPQQGRYDEYQQFVSVWLRFQRL